MNRDKYAPSRVQSHYQVGLLVMLETHRRINGRKFGPMPKPLSDDAFNMSGYCIDAHDVLPAGSMAFDKFGPDDEDWMWMPTTCLRSGDECATPPPVAE